MPMQLSADDREALLDIVSARFRAHPQRHPGVDWASVVARLDSTPAKWWSLQQMELTGGEPDVIGADSSTGTVLFCDCSAESPKGRRSICFDQAALNARKEHKPKDSAMNMAATMGIELLTEEQYRGLQKLGEFDTKTSSWVATPAAIRKLGGALFCDRRFDTVFVYHNGAESYYAARAFRGCFRV